jgi:diguanylate cyclase (GGDEF)-like protein
MEEILDREIPRARRKKTSVGIMMMDIDHFKDFNDTFGHDAGDLVLKSLTKLLQAKVRGEDIVCRFGGEEFILIMPETNLEIIYRRAKGIRKDVAALELSYEDKPLGPITISIGVAVFPEHEEIGDDVIQSADEALYRAKNQGRNRVIKAE